MGLFSFLRKQEPAADAGEFYSHAEEKPARSKRARKERADAPDPALPEKKRARRRLVGALALVLAAVIGLPMILDSEPQSVGDDIAIEIPSKDKSAPPSVRRAEPPAYPEQGTEQEGADEKPAQATPALSPAPAPSPAPASETPPAKDEHAGKAAAQPKPAASAPSATGKALPEPLAKGDDGERALALLEGKPAAKSAAGDAGEKFTVQVAALSSKAKIAELQSKLKHAGIASYTQSIATASGERTRIRVGPFGSRGEAEKMLKRLAKLGLKNATVVPGGA